MTTHDGRLVATERVLETLRRAEPDVVSYSQLLARTGLTKWGLTKALDALVSGWRVERIGVGLYRLTPGMGSYMSRGKHDV